MRILISGASIAGPAAAYWLSRYGHTVTVVERAPGSASQVGMLWTCSDLPWTFSSRWAC
jgi:2-polyprenyl-6-methoxyphenol hydroxylase-like FAD-dependent oxidoreductase